MSATTTSNVHSTATTTTSEFISIPVDDREHSSPVSVDADSITPVDSDGSATTGAKSASAEDTSAPARYPLSSQESAILAELINLVTSQLESPEFEIYTLFGGFNGSYIIGPYASIAGGKPGPAERGKIFMDEPCDIKCFYAAGFAFARRIEMFSDGFDKDIDGDTRIAKMEWPSVFDQLVKYEGRDRYFTRDMEDYFLVASATATSPRLPSASYVSDDPAALSSSSAASSPAYSVASVAGSVPVQVTGDPLYEASTAAWNSLLANLTPEIEQPTRPWAMFVDAGAEASLRWACPGGADALLALVDVRSLGDDSQSADGNDGIAYGICPRAPLPQHAAIVLTRAWEDHKVALRRVISSNRFVEIRIYAAQRIDNLSVLEEALKEWSGGHILINLAYMHLPGLSLVPVAPRVGVLASCEEAFPALHSYSAANPGQQTVVKPALETQTCVDAIASLLEAIEHEGEFYSVGGTAHMIASELVQLKSSKAGSASATGAGAARSPPHSPTISRWLFGSGSGGGGQRDRSGSIGRPAVVKGTASVIIVDRTLDLVSPCRFTDTLGDSMYSILHDNPDDSTASTSTATDDAILFGHGEDSHQHHQHQHQQQNSLGYSLAQLVQTMSDPTNCNSTWSKLATLSDRDVNNWIRDQLIETLKQHNVPLPRLPRILGRATLSQLEKLVAAWRSHLYSGSESSYSGLKPADEELFVLASTVVELLRRRAATHRDDAATVDRTIEDATGNPSNSNPNAAAQAIITTAAANISTVTPTTLRLCLQAWSVSGPGANPRTRLAFGPEHESQIFSSLVRSVLGSVPTSPSATRELQHEQLRRIKGAYETWLSRTVVPRLRAIGSARNGLHCPSVNQLASNGGYVPLLARIAHAILNPAHPDVRCITPVDMTSSAMNEFMAGFGGSKLGATAAMNDSIGAALSNRPNLAHNKTVIVIVVGGITFTEASAVLNAIPSALVLGTTIVTPQSTVNRVFGEPPNVHPSMNSNNNDDDGDLLNDDQLLNAQPLRFVSRRERQSKRRQELEQKLGRSSSSRSHRRLVEDDGDQPAALSTSASASTTTVTAASAASAVADVDTGTPTSTSEPSLLETVIRARKRHADELLRDKNMSIEELLIQEERERQQAEEKSLLESLSKRARLVSDVDLAPDDSMDSHVNISSKQPVQTSWKPPKHIRDILSSTPSYATEVRERELIQVEGECIPPPLQSFREMRFIEPILQYLKQKGIRKPSPIQCQGIPVALSGRDMIGIAMTGSGKSFSFLLPIIMFALEQEMKLPFTKGEGPVGLILNPSRELAKQTFDELNDIIKFIANWKRQSTQQRNEKRWRYTDGDSYNNGNGNGGDECYPELRSFLAIGGGSSSMSREQQQSQQHALLNGVHIVVATPGRLMAMVNSNQLSLGSCRYLCLDEADRMLDSPFVDDVRKLLQDFSSTHQHQTLLFSATMPKQIRDFAAKSLIRPIIVNVGRAGAASLNVKQYIERIDNPSDRFTMLLRTLQKTAPPVVIFSENQREVDEIHEFLLRNGVDAAGIHGGKQQEDRDYAVRAFRNGAKDVLVATDVASKGLDFRGVQHVINFDMPKLIENWIHRVGRSGRGGNKGMATTFIVPGTPESILLDLKHVLIEARQKIPKFIAAIYDPVGDSRLMELEARDAKQAGEAFEGCAHCQGLGHRVTQCPKLMKERQSRAMAVINQSRAYGSSSNM
ncbi:P-loop containing nucleoside triphosphate hydrolase protein [Ramicandelaber brevisporus]|nr:P-loop containing nucleoside triphosphate hydrolase protein [Ramicandelaber brevisporus]